MSKSNKPIIWWTIVWIMSAEGQVGSGGVTRSIFKWIGSKIIECIQRKGIRGDEWPPKGLIPKEEWVVKFNDTFQTELPWQPLGFMENTKGEIAHREDLLLSCSTTVTHCTSVCLFTPMPVKQLAKCDGLLQWHSNLRLHLRLFESHTRTDTGLTV